MSKRSKRIKKTLPKVILIGLLVVILAGAGFILVQCFKAPKISEINATPNGYLTTILDQEQTIIDTLYITESNRIYVPLDDIPVHLQQALIAIEDSRFYSHHGIDLKGIARAILHGIKNGGMTQGASTITQQLLKNNVFTDWMSEETFYERLTRKIQEQYLAIRLEQTYSKEWILENYLNTINLGGGTRGVQVAANYYFNKDVSELSLAESALIAGITKNPTAYNPVNHPEESLARQQLVLNAMLREEFISQEEYDAAMSENVIGALSTDGNISQKVFSWFEDALLNQVAKDLCDTYGYGETEAWDLIYSGGLTIYSTQNSKLQTICETEAVRPGWYSEGQEISIVMTDVSTGAVVAIVGSSQEKTGSLVYNRATDAVRQPGSTIKVIGEYAAAIDSQWLTLGSVLDDAPYTYSDGTALHNSYGTYRGMTTLRDAIASSSNIVALKAYQSVGGQKVFEYLQRFGLTTLTDDDKNEALSIGGTYNGVTNLELTAAYNAIANSGNYVEPYFYTKITDRSGKILLTRGTDFHQAVTAEAAALLSSAMEDVITSGTGKEAAVKNLKLAGKSGTTNKNRDLWFVGFSSSYTCGIWGGHDNNAEQSSGKYVKQIWQKIMQQAHLGLETQNLTDTSSLITVNICTKCGKLADGDLCGNTIQGNMIRSEYYISGTEPDETCDCHVLVTKCIHSGKTAGDYCPKSAVENISYLKAATEGTEDTAYVLPEDFAVTCDVHKYFWHQWFGGSSNTSPEATEQEPDKEKSWWEKLFNF